ncbi:Transcription factor domain-containing protein [Madurella fahalii]|uniref:Transcription factor domain-containing protein n=1 Tax=Madurella fahalii TaxID=1157608 RepID=A0ABQ0G547_9PEZI
MLLLEVMFDKQKFICRFVLGSSFADAVLAQLLTGLYAAPDTLLNVFLACSGRLARHMEPHAADRLGADLGYYSNSARAVQVLREAGTRAEIQLLEMADLLSAITLGLGVITFDLLDSGLHAHSICRFTVGLAERFYTAASWPRRRAPELDSALTPLVFMDICNCIIQRQLPVYRLETDRQDDELPAVDRYIGLCSSLLPHLSDICHLSHQLGSGASGRAEGAVARDLQAVRDAIRRWDPPVPAGFVLGSTLDEVRVVKTQAEAYRAAALAIIHRLRFGFGTRDDDARQLAARILEKVDDIYRHHKSPSNGAEPLFEYRLALPFLVAAVELEGGASRALALQRLGQVVSGKMYPNVSERLRRGLVAIWEARDGGFCGHWFDLVPRMPRFVLF